MNIITVISVIIAFFAALGAVGTFWLAYRKQQILIRPMVDIVGVTPTSNGTKVVLNIKVQNVGNIISECEIIAKYRLDNLNKQDAIVSKDMPKKLYLFPGQFRLLNVTCIVKDNTSIVTMSFQINYSSSLERSIVYQTFHEMMLKKENGFSKVSMIYNQTL